MIPFTEVPCPRCKAPVGRLCTGYARRERDTVHPAREQASRDAFLVAHGWEPLGRKVR